MTDKPFIVETRPSMRSDPEGRGAPAVAGPLAHLLLLVGMSLERLRRVRRCLRGIAAHA